MKLIELRVPREEVAGVAAAVGQIPGVKISLATRKSDMKPLAPSGSRHLEIESLAPLVLAGLQTAGALLSLTTALIAYLRERAKKETEKTDNAQAIYVLIGQQNLEQNLVINAKSDPEEVAGRLAAELKDEEG